ncbi:hypothetical protein [Dysgonomonas sp. HGC4]|uniref:hypothetical protein n=1 Tax=Dysgonomonas sp. HGC4 TaxID=1658009 RepID=UPI0006836E5B|nr:hypothetical protein [Dysgonomonas sp. HGC4]MBD8346678.1 hypothetical protein [Dysgonomonas sp. HGC4]
MRSKSFFLLPLFALILSIGFFACSKDDDAPAPPKPNPDPRDTIGPLVGTWKYTISTHDVDAVTPEIKDSVEKAIGELGGPVGSSYQFFADSTYNYKPLAESDSIVKGTYVLKDSIIIFDGKVDSPITYTLVADTIINAFQDVKAMIAEQLQLEEADITVATKTDVYNLLPKENNE